METKTLTDFTCTLLNNCFDNHGTKFSIFQWLEDIKNGVSKDAVLEARRLFKAGDEAGGKDIKHKLRAIIPTGYMPNGRTENDVIEMNGLMMVDIDIHDPEWSLQAIKKLVGRAGIIGAYRTVRGGLRIFILMPKDTTRDIFTFVENVILGEIDRILECEHDEQVTNITHLCSDSYDPETYIVDRNNIKEFPFEETLCRIQKNLYAELDGVEEPKKRKSKNKCSSTNTTDELSAEEELNLSFDQLMGKDHTSYSKTQIDNHLSRFYGRYPLTKGNRNKNLIRLGQYAHFMRYSVKELEYVIKTITYLLDCKEYNTKRVRQCLCWGYKHNDNQIDFEKITKQDFKGESFMKGQSLGHLGHSGHYESFTDEEFEQQTDFERVFRDTVENFCPYIPTSVYENIPDFFTSILSKSPNRRDTDISLIGGIIAAGAAMPKLVVQCREEVYSTNFYCLCIGPAASGKSASTKAVRLLSIIQAEMDEANEQRMTAFAKQQVAWDLELKRAIKENRDPDWEKQPKGQPVAQKIIAESQTSRSKLIIDLSNNPNGMFTYTAELNTINSSLHSQSGHHNAELAKIAMNEPVGLSYKNEMLDVQCPFPKLSIFAAGTPDQYVDFVGSLHEGMESRAITMLTTSIDGWMSWGEAEENALGSINQRYDEGALYLYRVYKYLEQSPTHVTIPSNLRYHCDKFCKLFMRRLKDEGYSSLDSIVKRTPILIARICGILCGLRKYDMALNCTEMEASEEDVEIALQIAITLIQHTFIAATMLVGKGKKIKAPHAIFKDDVVLKSIPETFSAGELAEYCTKNFELSPSTAKRMTQRWIKEGAIVKTKRGSYMKTRKTLLKF